MRVRQLKLNFLAEMGVSPKKFYRTMRLRYARWLLLNTEKRITVIAYECSFLPAPRFSSALVIRDFREVYGVTPGRLRVSLEERLPCARSKHATDLRGMCQRDVLRNVRYFIDRKDRNIF
ncbi:helix-turn-helix transcriptional regulator [Caballeronia sp. SBC2]|nr:helix-turn-helix transcriptional regulator [Caballeronia sp. SBC2]